MIDERDLANWAARARLEAEIERLRAALREIAAPVPDTARNDTLILCQRVMVARNALHSDFILEARHE